MNTQDIQVIGLLADEDPEAQRHIVKVQMEQNEQYLALRRRAQGLFAALKGRPGVRTPEEMDKLLEKARVDYENGSFLVERLGANRHLDPELTCVLVHLREDLLANISSPTSADRMNADAAVLAFRNLLRVQGLLNSALMETERQLFGQASLNDVLGRAEATEVERILTEVELRLMPLLERCQRMMNRALDRLPASGTRTELATQVTVGFAGHVHVKKG